MVEFAESNIDSLPFVVIWFNSVENSEYSRSRKGLNSTCIHRLMFICEREMVSAAILTKIFTPSYCLIDINPEQTSISSFRLNIYDSVL